MVIAKSAPSSFRLRSVVALIPVNFSFTDKVSDPSTSPKMACIGTLIRELFVMRPLALAGAISKGVSETGLTVRVKLCEAEKEELDKSDS